MGSASSRTAPHRPHPPLTTSVEEFVQLCSGMQPQPQWLSTENFRDGPTRRDLDNQRPTTSRNVFIASDSGPPSHGGNGGSNNSLPCFLFPTQSESSAPPPTNLEICGIGQVGPLLTQQPLHPSPIDHPIVASLHRQHHQEDQLHQGGVGPSRVIHEEVDQNNLVFGEGSRQALDDERLHVTYEMTLQRHRVSEMQEQLRRCAGFPPTSDLHELGRRGLMASETTEAQQRMDMMSATSHHGLFSSSSGQDVHGMSVWAAPSSMQALNHSDLWEGSYVGPSYTVASSRRASPPSGDTSSGLRRGSTSGRESRRNSGRRLWDALSRATLHRRSSASRTTMTMAASVSEDTETNAMALDGVDSTVDVGGLHGSRALDLEERRRRVRLQVWALRRLSNGLEGVPWHSRTCSSNHHGHRCSCDVHGIANDTNTRASISRIIMLAEALFEVLDEIHRQSVALSRSATGSRAPAPSLIVDGFPTRIHLSKAVVACTETLQCHICLVDYVDGDQIRVLPCQHEYHKACVDKWLKEVHRVCPLCRGDVCNMKPLETTVQIAAELEST